MLQNATYCELITTWTTTQGALPFTARSTLQAACYERGSSFTRLVT